MNDFNKLARIYLRQGWRSGLNAWFVIGAEEHALLVNVDNAENLFHLEETAPGRAWKCWPAKEWRESQEARAVANAASEERRSAALERDRVFSAALSDMTRKLGPARGLTEAQCADILRQARDGHPAYAKIKAKYFPES